MTNNSQMEDKLLTNGELLTNKILHAELSYKLVSLVIEISRKYGYLHKEQVYQKVMEELLIKNSIPFIAQPRINVHSLDTGKSLAVYVPDLLLDQKIIVELKALPFVPKPQINKLEQYLKTSRYEVAYMVNFGTPKAQIVRRIYTNDRKPFVSHS